MFLSLVVFYVLSLLIFFQNQKLKKNTLSCSLNLHLSRQSRELEHLRDDFEARRDLPREQEEVDAVERDVQRPRRVVSLLHRRDERRGGCPKNNNAGSGVEVRAGEELARAEIRINRPFDRDQDAEREQQGPPVEVLVPRARRDEGLALGLEPGDLGVERGRRACCGCSCSVLSTNSSGFRQLRLERLDEVRDLPRPAPAEAEPPRVARRAEEEEHDSRVEQRDELAREEVVVSSGSRCEGREGDREGGGGGGSEGGEGGEPLEVFCVCVCEFLEFLFCLQRRLDGFSLFVHRPNKKRGEFMPLPGTNRRDFGFYVSSIISITR